TVAVFLRRARRATPDAFTVIVENFRAGTTGTGITHLPEIIRGIGRALVVADADDALNRHADILRPASVGFIVTCIDRDPELFLRDLHPVVASEEFPGKTDGIVLEIVAETEVAEHLEEGVMPRGVADIFQVVVLAAGTHATLAAHRPYIVALLATEETVLELVHAGVGEQ